MIRDFRNDTLLLEISEATDILIYKETLEEARKIGVSKVLLVAVSDYVELNVWNKASAICADLNMQLLPRQLFYRGEFFEEPMMCKTDDNGKLKTLSMWKMETFEHYKLNHLDAVKNRKIINIKELKL